MLASVFGNEDVVKLLLNAGADVTLKDDLGLTAREWSLRRGFTRIAEMIADVSPYEESSEANREESLPPDSPPMQKEVTAQSHEELALSVDASDPVAEMRQDENEESAVADNGKRELGGAAGAILRTRAAQAGREVDAFEPGRSFEARGQSVDQNNEGTVPPPTLPNNPSASFEEEPVFEVSGGRFQEDIPTRTQAPEALQEDPASQWSMGAEPDPLTLPPELLNGSHALSESDYYQTTPDLLTLPPDEPDEATETTRTFTSQQNEEVEYSTRREILSPAREIDSTRRTDLTREIKVPSFHTLQTQSSMRPMLWLLILAVLGGSAFLAYRLNSYFFSANNAGPVAAQDEKRVGPSVENGVSSPATTQPSNPTNAPTIDGSSNTAGDGPVTGGPLAGTERELPKPDYPSNARSKNVVGAVTMLVRVNRQGRVISWRTLDGDPLLRAAALKAAKKATFIPDKLPGNGEVVGTIRYNFPP